MPDSIYRQYNLVTLAKNLRHNMTAQERKLWYTFLRDYPVRVYKQRIIGHYIADFYCSKAKLVIELDGSQHYEDEAMDYDRQREEYMKNEGIHTLRFTNTQVDRQFDEVCGEIDRSINTRIHQ